MPEILENDWEALFWSAQIFKETFFVYPEESHSFSGNFSPFEFQNTLLSF